MLMEKAFEIIEEQFDKVFLNPKSTIDHTPLSKDQSTMIVLLEIYTGKRKKDCFNHCIEVFLENENSLRCKLTHPVLYAVDEGRRILNPGGQIASQKVVTTDFTPLGSLFFSFFSGIEESINLARQLASYYEYKNPIELPNGIVCTELGKNFFRYSYKDWFSLVYETNATSDEENIKDSLFHCDVYKKSYSSHKGYNILQPKQTYLIFEDLFIRSNS